jgi:hypothetical protein
LVVAVGSIREPKLIVGQLTDKEKICDPLHPLLSVAVTVTEKVPGEDGVPEMVPDAESESPAGRAPPVTA